VSDGPGDYADDLQCTWRITAAGPITVVFKAFATEPGYDFVTLVGGTGGEVNYSGVALPPQFSSNSTSLTIVFTSDGATGSGGFELEVFALVPDGTWAPTAAPTTAVPTTGTPTAAPSTAVPATAAPTYAPDIPGTHMHKNTPARAHSFKHTRTHGRIILQRNDQTAHCTMLTTS
jgi:hypothetical protein